MSNKKSKLYLSFNALITDLKSLKIIKLIYKDLFFLWMKETDLQFVDSNAALRRHKWKLKE